MKINKLTEIRVKKGYTQKDIADQLNIGISTYNQYETGARTIPKKIASEIAALLNVSNNDIFLPVKFTVSKT